MLFSSVVFIFYFLPIALAGYYLLCFSRRGQNIWLVIISLFFYAWGEPIFVFALVLLTLFNHMMGIALAKARENTLKSRRILIITCSINLGLLFFCKYLGFIMRNIGMLLQINGTLSFTDIHLPLGISFFTFQAISYIIDISKKEANPQKNPLYTALYITFFPQLVAGPILQYTDIESQLENRRSNWDRISKGICRFIGGISKKVLIANNMSTIATHTFNLSAMSNDLITVPASMAWIGLIAYMIQIYFDFSGYSDMAIGLGDMFGFSIKENFNYPYIALSMADFWHRWHISLYEWFKKYVYFPLGGSKVSNKDKMVKNIFIVWLLTGIWHGAEWTFILWGMWQFVFIVFERVTNFKDVQLPNFIKRAYVFIVLLFSWVIFRANNIHQVMPYFGNMFGLNNNGFFSDTALMFLREYWIFFLAGAVFSTPIIKNISNGLKEGQMNKWKKILTIGYPVVIMTVFVITISCLIRGTYNPFIYFNF